MSAASQPASTANTTVYLSEGQTPCGDLANVTSEQAGTETLPPFHEFVSSVYALLGIAVGSIVLAPILLGLWLAIYVFVPSTLGVGLYGAGLGGLILLLAMYLQREFQDGTRNVPSITYQCKDGSKAVKGGTMGRWIGAIAAWTTIVVSVVGLFFTVVSFITPSPTSNRNRPRSNGASTAALG